MARAEALELGARARFHAGDAAGAAQLASAALAQDDGRNSARLVLALAQRELGDPEAAYETISQASELSVASTDEICRLAELLFETEKHDAAKALLEEAHRACPEAADVVELLCGAYLENREYEELLAAATPFVEGEAPSLALLEAVAASWEQRGDLRRAEYYARQAVMRAPLDAYAQFRLAATEQRNGQTAAAIARFLLVLELEAVDSDLLDAAHEAVETLDAVQLQQIAALASTSVVFRLGFGRDPETALRERGFRLSDAGMGALRAADLDELAGRPVHIDRRMSH